MSNLLPHYALIIRYFIYVCYPNYAGLSTNNPYQIVNFYIEILYKLTETPAKNALFYGFRPK